jgi:hypothetical protein
MEPNLITAMAGVFGSLVGASASIATTWLTKRTEIVRTTAERNLHERESLYNQFLTEASRVAVHALTHSFEGPDQIVALYGILSRIRLVASNSVVREGEMCCVQILAQYGKPGVTVDELRGVLLGAANDLAELDPLKAFSNACREELRLIEQRIYRPA